MLNCEKGESVSQLRQAHEPNTPGMENMIKKISDLQARVK